MRYRELAIAPNISTTIQRALKTLVCIYSTLCESTSMVISESKKTESIRRINNPKATGSEPLRKLEPRLSRYEYRQSRLRIKPLRDVGPCLVDHDRNVVSFSEQLPVTALDNLAVVLFRLDHEQKLVHKSSHPPRGTRLLQRGHIKNDVVEVACF